MSRWHTRLLNNITTGINSSDPDIKKAKLATFVTDADAVAQNPRLKGLKGLNGSPDFTWTDTSTWNNNLQNGILSRDTRFGVGFTEAPRGALGHWLSIQDGKILNYQCIVASQWNAGPRDADGVPGPYEKSLEGHTLTLNPKYDPAKDPLSNKLLGPLEILRTIHSFDPCIGCAVHVTDPNGEELIKVNVSTTLR
jgi:hydrogenase large subunit